jgi:hypothetical protein
VRLSPISACMIGGVFFSLLASRIIQG